MVERVVVAPDKFKGSLSAAAVTARVAAGLALAGFGGEVVPVPVADGGDGTVDAAVAAGYRRIDVEVAGPVGQAVTASFALLDGTAVIEAAQACGLTLLPPGELAPLTATSRGVGELILAARRMGAERIVLGVGGVATTDGGAGLVQALGAQLADESGRALPPGGAALSGLASLDLSRLADLSGVEFWLASDVDNPLLGPSGAAAVYGPQKGASGDDVRILEAGLARWADIAQAAVAAEAAVAAGAMDWAAGPADRAADQPGAGAAGGLGFAALLFLRARMRPGIELLLELASFGERLDGARLVITGEGSLDAADAAREDPGRSGPGRRRARAAGPGGGGGGPVHADPGGASRGGHLRRLRRHRHRIRPGPVHGQRRPAGRAAGRAHRGRLARLAKDRPLSYSLPCNHIGRYRGQRR